MINYSDSRRQFLKRLTFGFSASLLFKGTLLWANQKSIHIANIEVFPVNYPMIGRFKFFEGPEGHMIGRASAIVKVTASDGTVGWGESIPIPKWSYETLVSADGVFQVFHRASWFGRTGRRHHQDHHLERDSGMGPVPAHCQMEL